MLAFYSIRQLFSVYCPYFLFMWMKFLKHPVYKKKIAKLLLVVKQLRSEWKIKKFKLLSESIKC